MRFSRPRRGAGRGAVPTRRGAGTMGSWTSRARVPTPELDPRETLDLSRLPPELLLLVLSHVPPRALLLHCRRVCRAWRALVDGQALWLMVLARDRSAAGRALLTLARRCLPPAREDRPCPLGQLCLRGPLGRNLISNPCGQEGLRKWMVQHGGDGWVVEKNMKPVPGAPSQTCFVTSFSWCRKKQVVDLEEKGLWPELLDSGGVEIAVSDWWGARHDSGCRYRLLVKLLDAHQNVLDKFSAVPDPIEQWNNNIYLQKLAADWNPSRMKRSNLPGTCHSAISGGSCLATLRISNTGVLHQLRPLLLLVEQGCRAHARLKEVTSCLCFSLLG